MGGCQNYGPFLGTLNIRGRIIIGIQKGTIILTTTHMSCSQYFLPNLMDMGSLLGAILGTILNYKRDPMSSMSCSQYFLHNLMDMGSLLGTMLGTILNYKKAFMSIVKGPLIRLILTVAHMRKWICMLHKVQITFGLFHSLERIGSLEHDLTGVLLGTKDLKEPLLLEHNPSTELFQV